MDTKKRAIFIDIDGCLLSGQGNVCAQYYASLSIISELARKAFIGTFPSIHLCSSRDRNSVELMANLLGIVNTWMIIEGGAAIFNPSTREIRFNPAITSKTRKLFKWLGAKKIPQVLRAFNKDSEILQVYPGYMVCHSLERLAAANIGIETICNFVKGQKQEGVKKRSKGLLTDLIGKKLIKADCYFNRAVNIVPAGVSKGSAVKFLAQLEGIDLSWSLAIGDSSQDFSVFRRAGLIGCPNNATDDCKKLVKKRKGKISQHNHAEAVLDIIKTYFPQGN